MNLEGQMEDTWHITFFIDVSLIPWRLDITLYNFYKILYYFYHPLPTPQLLHHTTFFQITRNKQKNCSGNQL